MKTNDQMTMTQIAITPGKYKHYKGSFYQVYGTAQHSETEEVLVLYRPLYGEGKMWVRPLAMFAESVNIEGEEVSRFALVEESDSQVLPPIDNKFD